MVSYVAVVVAHLSPVWILSVSAFSVMRDIEPRATVVLCPAILRIGNLVPGALRVFGSIRILLSPSAPPSSPQYVPEPHATRDDGAADRVYATRDDGAADRVYIPP
jgi:hypothetical protein